MPRSHPASASSGPSPRRGDARRPRAPVAPRLRTPGAAWVRWLFLGALLLIGALLWAPLAQAISQETGSPAAAAREAASAAAATRTGVSQTEGPSGHADGAPGQPKDALELGANVQLPATPDGFSSHDGGWLKVDFPPSVRHRVQPLLRDADTFRERLRDLFGQPVLEHVVVRVARTAGEMATLAPPESPFPKYAEGVAYPGLALVLLTIEPLHPNSVHDLAEVFHHELAHVALNEALQGRHVPLWLNEGLAIHLSGESMLDRLQTLSMATLSETLLPLVQLDWRFPDDLVQTPIAYAESADVVRHLLRTRYSQRFIAMLHRVRSGQSFENAMLDAYGFNVYGVGANSLEDEWRREVAKRYSFWPVLFSGSMLWIGVLGLFTVGYFRSRSKQRLTLERWAMEEAAEQRPKPRDPAFAGRMHIVLAPKPAPAPESIVPEFKKGVVEVDVPKVEHDGSWHTLH